MMRAKMKVETVTQTEGNEILKFRAVCRTGAYPSDESEDEDTFAVWIPGATLEMYITNPAIYGKFKPGQKFYLDFTLAE